MFKILSSIKQKIEAQESNTQDQRLILAPMELKLDVQDFRMRVIFFLLVLIIIGHSTFSQRIFYPKLEKRAWEVFANGDTIEMYCCQYSYMSRLAVKRFKDTYFYRGYLYSQLRYMRDSTSRAFNLIRFNNNITYKYRRRNFKRYFVLTDHQNNTTYWYRIISFKYYKSINEYRFRLIKAKGERIFSDPYYVPCCQ